MRFGPRAFLIFIDDAGARREIEIEVKNITSEGVLTLARPPSDSLRMHTLETLSVSVEIQCQLEVECAPKLQRTIESPIRGRRSKGDRHRNRHNRWSIPR